MFKSQGSLKLLLTATFVVVLCVTAFLVYGSLRNLERVRSQADTLLNRHQVRLILLSDLYALARERSTLLLQMAEEKDPFARDDMFMRFNTIATSFAELRQRLLRHSLSAAETELLRLQGSATTSTARLQNEIADLIVEGKIELARQRLATQALPAQERAMAHLATLSRLVSEQAREMAQRGQRHYEQAVRQLLMIGAITVGMILTLLGYFLYRFSAGERLILGRATATLNSVNEAVITTDRHQHVDFMNPLAEKLTGWSQDEADGKHIDRIYRVLSNRQRAPLPDPADYQKHNLLRSEDLALLNREGEPIPIEDSIAMIHSRRGRHLGTAIVFRDVRERRRLTERLSYQASHDALTGLHNRYAFERRLQNAIDNATGQATRSTLLYLDLDQFKIVNDTCGHAAGDELLKQLAEQLQGKLRSADTLARLGGDEFGVLLVNCPTSIAQRIAEGLLKVVSDYQFSWDEHSFRLGVSIGITELNEHTPDRHQALREADLACFAAKRNGRHRQHTYSQSDASVQQQSGELHWMSRLTNALEDNRLVLHAQTILPLAERAQHPIHFEVLIRMLDEDGDLVMPGAFIPVAERYGLMPRLDRWVIRHTLQTLSDSDLPTSQLLCSINLCGASLNDESLYDFIAEQIDQSGVAADSLCFELTETDAIANLLGARTFIERLRKRGCSFALDDFGSGHASYTYLKNLPVDYIKIDGGFIRDLLSEPLDQEIVQSLNRVAHVMGIRTIAEFVSDDEILAALREMQVDAAQGYAIGRPQPLEQLIERHSPPQAGRRAG